MYQQERKHLSTKLFIVRAIAAAISPLIVSIITRNARLGEHAYSAMDYSNASSNGGGIPLDARNKDTPPGWRPGTAKQPLRRYIQLLRL